MYLCYSISNGLGYSDPDIEIFNRYDNHKNMVNSSDWLLGRLVNNFDGEDLELLPNLSDGDKNLFDLSIKYEEDNWLLGRKEYDENCYNILKIDTGINEVELLSYDSFEVFELGKSDIMKVYKPIEDIEFGNNYISWHYEDGFMYLRLIK